MKIQSLLSKSHKSHKKTRSPLLKPPWWKDSTAAMLKVSLTKHVTLCGVDENGQPYYHCVIKDGHKSQVDKDFLTYINEPLTKWAIALGAPYRSALWQLHDNKRQNGAFKFALVNAKKKMNLKKRVNKLPVGILPQEIVLIVKDAVDSSFMNVRFTLSALSHRGMYPFNRNPLMDSEILAMAPDDVHHERTDVLHMRGDVLGECTVDTHCVLFFTTNFVHSPFSFGCCIFEGALLIPPMEANQLENGSGHLAGGVDAAEDFSKTLHDLNHNNPTTAILFKLVQNARDLEAGRMNHNLQSSAPSVEEMQQRYKDVPWITAGAIFGAGDGILGEYARDKVIRRRKVREEIDTAAANKKKPELTKLINQYKRIKIEMPKQGFKWTIAKLNIAIKCKKFQGESMPTGKEALLTQWSSIKRRPTPQTSPANSDDEGSVSDDNEANTRGLIFGGDSDSSDCNSLSDDEEGESDEEIDADN